MFPNRKFVPYDKDFNFVNSRLVITGTPLILRLLRLPICRGAESPRQMFKSFYLASCFCVHQTVDKADQSGVAEEFYLGSSTRQSQA
jgi:hypothetical protein